ncbi:class I SAM-dependent methyltransferase [Brevibacillus brevis]|uniref:Class I SAM-dependent methyltransferase n=1 Tax=Brevibacillus brevis TaxID=1393 RepID=A0ABY9T016_BREBE|nr:class I SAM-dependent methyltransferase [Brevibacillus brevis]WNC13308.1 class I SAM-dependent methyltransferase [Brevibacillus brevis]
MKQNKYDDESFFLAYQQMPRSIRGLEAAGEWQELRSLLPDLRSKRVLDLGCGYGWHCRYAREQQASSVVGVDLSEKMLQKAREQTNDPAIAYVQMAIEDIAFADGEFDVVLSSLALHYVEAFGALCQKVYDCLKQGGTFLFSVEHPIFTSRAEQDWCYGPNGERLHWPVDDYQSEGVRVTSFLDENVIKYHRTIATYMNDVIEAGFVIKAVREPKPPKEMMQQDVRMKEELRRPMMLILSAEKPASQKRSTE